MTTVGVVGLGNMGLGMALSLKRSGFRVLGVDVAPEMRARAQAQELEVFDGVALLCRTAEVAVLSLPNAQIVEAATCGVGGLIEYARSDLVVIDTSTSHPNVTRKISKKLAEKGVCLIDAPVSGGPKGAVEGSLTMMLGGKESDIAKVEPVLAAMSAKRVHVGASGAGHVVKIVNNLLCAAHLLTGAEAVRIAQEAGVDLARMLEGLNAGSGRSGITQVNFPNWILNGSFNSGFTMKLMRKDVRLVVQLLRELDLSLPFAELTAQIWTDSENAISDDEDFNRIATYHPTSVR